eukprot:886798-Prymnesium_polylepis.1
MSSSALMSCSQRAPRSTAEALRRKRRFDGSAGDAPSGSRSTCSPVFRASCRATRCSRCRSGFHCSCYR